MPRLLTFAILLFGASAALTAGVLVGCSDDVDTGPETPAADAGAFGLRDSAVEPAEASGEMLDGGETVVAPSCEKYCSLVMANCAGNNAQYASSEDCLAFCAKLPPTTTGAGKVEESPTVACRQYWADSPAKTDPDGYCLQAGPFGGNVCGNRCTAFCTVLLNACSPDGGTPAFDSQPACQDACAGFTYRDGGLDGGGEAPTGPKNGDTLNCRLYYLRAATTDAVQCVKLQPDGGACY